jgi:hypothetical protein
VEIGDEGNRLLFMVPFPEVTVASDDTPEP